MKRQKVQSSNLESVGYESANKVVEVKFVGGGVYVYQYSGVPQDIYENMMKAESIGKYFMANIRNPVGKYPFKKIEETVNEEKSVAPQANQEGTSS